MRIPFRLPVKVVPGLFGISTVDEPKIGRNDGEVKKTGWVAVKGMIELDEYGEVKPEMSNFLSATCCGLVGGAVYGGVTKSRFAYEDFIRNNHATAFQSHFEAKRALSNKVSLSFGHGAFYFGWRTAAFCAIFSFMVNAVALYRGNQGVLEYVIGGAVAGFLFKMNLGLRGMIVGGALGGFLGLIGGTITMSLLWLSGASFDEVKQIDYEWHKMRNLALKEMEWDDRKSTTPSIVSIMVDAEQNAAGGPLSRLPEDNLDLIGKENHYVKEQKNVTIHK